VATAPAFFFGVRSSGVPGAKSQLGDSGKTFLVDASGTILSAVQIQDSAAEAIFLSELVGEVNWKSSRLVPSGNLT
jgi:hypothetical protein